MTQSMFFDIIARDKASSTFSKVGKASETARGRLLGFGKTALGAAAGFTSITLAAGAFVRVGADYVGSLNKIQALTGASDAQTKRAAKTLESQSSVYAKMGQTVGDAAGGVVELTKAGLSLDKSLTAVNATMVLAKAGELSVADASSLVANTLNTFGLKASRAGDIANYLANAANISSADVTDLAESFKYVSPIAAATGVSLKQTNAILAELSNSGIAASNAGTGFRKFLLSLQAPSGAAGKDLKALGVEIFNAQGKMKPLGTVIDILGSKLNKLTDQKRQKVLKDVFGLQGISAAQVILKNGSKGLDEYTKGVGKAGAAQKLANAASKGFAGTLSALRAEIVSDAQAAYRKMSPAFDDVAKKVLAFVQQMKSGKGAGGDFAGAMKDLATVVKDVAKFLSGLPGPVKKFGAEGLIAYFVVRRLAAGAVTMGQSFTVASAKASQLAAEMTYTATRGQAVSAVMGKISAAARMAAGVGGMLLLADSAQKANQSLGFLEKVGGGALLGFSVGGPVGAAIGGAAGAIVGLATATRDTGNSMVTAAQKTQHWTDALHGLTAASSEEARNEALKSLNEQTKAMTGTATAAVALGIKQRDLVNYITNEAGARERVQAIIDRGMKAPFGSTQQRNAALTQLLVDALKGEGDQLAGVISKNKQHNAVVRSLAENVAKLPKKVQTEITALKGKATLKDVAELAVQYKLQPKKVQTLIEALHLKATVADVLDLTHKTKAYGEMSASAKFNADTMAAAAKIQALINSISRIRDKTVHITTVTNATVAEHAGTGGGGKKGGGKSGGRFAGSGRGSSMEGAGRSLGDSYAKGIDSSRSKVSKALSKFTDLASKAADKLSSLNDLKSGFLSTFQADNLFGVDLSGGGGVSALIAFEQKQADQAKQLMSDIQTVAGMGLSKSLISQLQAQGTSGATQLHAIATGGSGAIQQLNSLDAQTQASLQGAGMLAGNTVRGGSIDSDAAKAAAEDARLEKLLAKLHKLQGDDVVVINIDSEEIIRVIKKRNRRKGVATAGM